MDGRPEKGSPVPHHVDDANWGLNIMVLRDYCEKEAGIPLPRKTGKKADFGAAFVEDVWHDKIQVDLGMNSRRENQNS